jgi:ribosomal protein S18 acetylase RimI-like enzyme
VRLAPIRTEDAPFLFALYAASRKEELSVTDWSDEQKQQFLAMQFAAQHQAYTTNYPGATLDVLEAGDEKIGRLYVYRGTTEIRIIDIAVVDAHRNRGIGSNLLRSILEEGRSSGRAVTIHVEKNNPALRLYERLGFEITADREAYWFMTATPSVEDGFVQRAAPVGLQRHQEDR